MTKTKDPLKILVVHNNYQKIGGEKVAVDNQVALLKRRNCLVNTYFVDNRDINHYGLVKKVLFLGETIFSLKTVQEIRSLVRKSRPDIVHVHNIFPLISPSLYWILHRYGIPIVQSVHNFRFLCPNALFYTHGRICEKCKYGNTMFAVRWRCYRQSYILSALYALTIGLHRRLGTFFLIDHFIPVSEFVARKLIEGRIASEKKITVLGNFLPDPLPEQGSFEHRDPYFVCLGRLSFEKGLDTLFDAVSGLSNVNLKIAGEGPLAERLKSRAYYQRLSVEFLGHVTGQQKWNLLRNATACIVPSVWYETFSISALESLAVGTPVIAANIGGLPSVVEDGKSGLLFRAGCSDDLRDKLVWAILHPRETLAMGHFGRGAVEEEYSSESYYNRLMQIYSKVLNKKQSSYSNMLAMY